MSSPNAKPRYSAWDRVSIWLHRRTSHGMRVAVLARTLAPHVAEGSSLLDLGCGDMSLATALARGRGLRRCVGADIWPARQPPPEGLEYAQVEILGPLPWGASEFDTVLLVDALHHAAVPERLLSEALRVGRRVLVKDHLEYGPFSRTLLRMLDYLGNHAYGVPTPGRHFRPGDFEALAARLAPTRPLQLWVGVDIYGHLPLSRWLLPARLHFVAEIGAGA